MKPFCQFFFMASKGNATAFKFLQRMLLLPCWCLIFFSPPIFVPHELVSGSILVANIGRLILIDNS
jgi:hypothetical protein